MSPKKLLLLTAIVAALFAFIALFERKMPTTSERERKGDLYWDIPEEQIGRIELTRDGEKLEFARAAGSGWKMIRPEKYPADDFAVNLVATNLAELKRVGEDSADARPADYGLETPVATATLTWTDPQDPKAPKTRTIEFGKEVPGTDVVAARVAGTEKVLFVPESVLADLRKKADDFQSKDVFGGTASAISRMEILRGRSRLVLSRKDAGWWLSEPLADLADSAEADRLAGQLASLRVQEFLHGTQDLAALGLSPPLYRVTVTGDKGALTSVDFGSVRSDGDSVYARRDGQVLTVEREIVDDLSREAEPFRSAKLLAFNRSEVTTLEASFDGASYALQQGDGGWASQGRPVLAASADDVLSALLDLKSRSFLDPAAIATLEAPKASVTVKAKSGLAGTLTFYPRAAEMIAKVSARPGGFLVDSDAPSRLEAAFKKAVTSPTPVSTPAATPKP